MGVRLVVTHKGAKSVRQKDRNVVVHVYALVARISEEDAICNQANVFECNYIK